MKRKPATKQITRMRQLRRAREWSQRYLAARVGISHAAICQFETGVAKPSHDVGIALARHLGCTVETLLERVEIPA